LQTTIFFDILHRRNFFSFQHIASTLAEARVSIPEFGEIATLFVVEVTALALEGSQMPNAVGKR